MVTHTFSSMVVITVQWTTQINSERESTTSCHIGNIFLTKKQTLEIIITMHYGHNNSTITFINCFQLTRRALLYHR